jgi:hypothetical protein
MPVERAAVIRVINRKNMKRRLLMVIVARPMVFSCGHEVVGHQ